MHPSKSRGGWLVVLGVYWLFQILYVLSPVDLVPDFIPVFGLADDVFGVLAGLGISAYTLYREYGAPALPEVEPYRSLTANEIDEL